ncbi:MAG: hypothetical protein FWC96_00850 [Oscillospiraceae bacterium]|nr:hypothetical protein [Oscillospiraceae bacterium]
MKKRVLISMFAIIFLIASCTSASDADADYEDYAGEPEQLTPAYESEPENGYPGEYDHVAEPPAESPAVPRNAVAISAASTHALALMEDGTLWAWGWGAAGRDWDVHHSLIGDGTTERRNWPVQIMENVTFTVAGHHHSFAITTDGALWAWGGNQYGQLGDGTTETRLSPVRIMDDVVYVTMPSTAPNSHVGDGVRSYTIRSDGGLWAWGHSGINDVPWEVALGDGGLENRYTPVLILENVVSVVPTHNGGFVLTDDGTLWNWHGWTLLSSFEDGEFISTEIEARLYPAPIMENVASLSSCANFAITTDGELWSLGFEPAWIMDDVAYATALSGANFAITTNGTLWAWGRNRLPDHWHPGPLLGDGTTVDRDEPVKILENVASVVALGNNAYAITADGALWTWGSGTLSSLYSEAEEHMWSYAYNEDGFPEGKRWLLDDDGGTGIRLSPVKILENVVSVSPTYFMFDHGFVRGFRTFALTECGAVWAWGENDIWDQGWSLLGDGTSEYRPDPVLIIGGE